MSKLIPPQDPENNNGNNYPPLPPIPDLPAELIGKRIKYQRTSIDFKGDITRIRSEFPMFLDMLKKGYQRKELAKRLTNNIIYFICETEKELQDYLDLISKGRPKNIESRKVEKLEGNYRVNMFFLNTLLKYYNFIKNPLFAESVLLSFLDTHQNYNLDKQYSCDYFFILLIEFIGFLDYCNINSGDGTNYKPAYFFDICYDIFNKEMVILGKQSVMSERIETLLYTDSPKKRKVIERSNSFKNELNKDQSLCFAYALRQTRILEIDNFLNYHQERHEGDNFCGLIEAAVKEHRELVNDFQFEKVMSWVEMNRTAPVIFETELFFDHKSDGIDKTDLIRIIHGIEGLEWIKDENGKPASLQKIVDAFSRMFNVSLNNHGSLFSRGLNNSEQSNIKAFEDMKSIILEKRRKKGKKD